MAYREKAIQFKTRMKDVTEFLASIDLNPEMGAVDVVATYQDSCHLAHGQKIKDAPRELLKAVPGLVFREMPMADLCCGSAGIYNVVHNEHGDADPATKNGAYRRSDGCDSDCHRKSRMHAAACGRRAAIRERTTRRCMLWKCWMKHIEIIPRKNGLAVYDTEAANRAAVVLKFVSHRTRSEDRESHSRRFLGLVEDSHLRARRLRRSSMASRRALCSRSGS